MWLSFAHSLSLSEVDTLPPVRLLNCMTTGTREPMDGVLRASGECGKKTLFPVDPLCPQQARILLALDGREWGNGKHPVTSMFRSIVVLTEAQ